MIIMQAATEAAPSSMVSVIGLNSDKITAIRNAANDEVSEDEKVQIANFLYPVSWPIYVFCCFSFTSGVVLGIINIYVKTYAYVPSKSTAFSSLYEPCQEIFCSNHPATKMEQKGDVDHVTITI
jgi:hypothetical protein